MVNFTCKLAYIINNYWIVECLQNFQELQQAGIMGKTQQFNRSSAVERLLSFSAPKDAGL